ncbi:glycine-rich cell wall structural protein 1.0-like [Lynx canadensis]|uniref:glycine-rich cell wall structural protein 1.0-like n=1 Tax=Lynx canadensis TaxID=61383 RepID=UPI0011B04C1B|nr:glycine-rich cell wall structural protein 1.0-like [Lynx canadensis]
MSRSGWEEGAGRSDREQGRERGREDRAALGLDPAPGTGAGKSRGGGRTGGRWGGRGAERGWGRGRGLRGRRGGGSGYRAEGGGGEGRGRGAAAANLASSAGRLWRRRRPGGGGGGGEGKDGPTARGARTDGWLPGADRGPGDGGGGRCAAPGPARAGAARGADRGRTAPQDRAREPAPRGGQCPRPPGPSGRARPALRPLPGGGGGGAAGGFVLSRRQWGRGGLGLRDEGERERERGGRAWGSLCV